MQDLMKAMMEVRRPMLCCSHSMKNVMLSSLKMSSISADVQSGTSIIMYVAVCSVLKTGGRTKLPDRHRVIVGL